jgi:putative ABC transport system substrate-binding protein
MKQIGELAIPKRLPLISVCAEFPQAGGFMAYGPNMRQFYRRSGDYVAKILQGAKPSDLPIQRPEKFDLVINLKTAAALGVTVPPLLLATADEVIESPPHPRLPPPPAEPNCRADAPGIALGEFRPSPRLTP